MSVEKAKTNMIVAVEDIKDYLRLAVHAQHVIPYLIVSNGIRAPEELRWQTA